MPRRNLADLLGQRFGRWLITEVFKKPGKPTKFRVLCDCGTEEIKHYANITSGASKSCGCLNKELMATKFRTHGHTAGTKDGCGDRAYRTWASIKRRCSLEGQENYERYGGRGISVCERWKDSFEAFLEDMGEPPDGMTIDRFPDTNGNYEPGNCRWATIEEQANNKRTSRLIEYLDRTQTMAQWCRELGLDYGMVRSRLDDYGWSVGEAFTLPSSPLSRSKRGLLDGVE